MSIFGRFVGTSVTRLLSGIVRVPAVSSYSAYSSFCKIQQRFCINVPFGMKQLGSTGKYSLCQESWAVTGKYSLCQKVGHRDEKLFLNFKTKNLVFPMSQCQSILYQSISQITFLEDQSYIPCFEPKRFFC